jgi:uncharacterized protein YdcH (DUF465 family)
MDTIAAKLISYENTGISINELQDIVRSSELEKKREVCSFLEDGKLTSLKDSPTLQIEEAIVMITTLLNYAEDVSHLSFDKSLDLNCVSKPEAFDDSNVVNSNQGLLLDDSVDGFQRRISNSFNPDQSRRFHDHKSFWSSVDPIIESESPKKDDDWLSSDVPDMSPDSFSFETSSPFKKKEFRATPSSLSHMSSVMSPISNVKSSPSKSTTLIDLDSPKVMTKPPRYSTPSSVQLSFDSETTPTENKLAGMVGIPSETPSRLTKQLEKTEYLLTVSEEKYARLQGQFSDIENEKSLFRKDIKELKGKNERLEVMVHEYETQLQQCKQQVNNTESVSNTAYSRLKGTLY